MSFAWSDREVRKALGKNVERARPELVFSGICTDSRSVGEGDLFVALVGERHDGHDFVPDALARGAAGIVVSREVPSEESTPLYPVEDTLVALGALARHRRSLLKARVVGITGSSGKTTAKELIREVLSGSFRVHATRGNLNNRIGLPLSLLATPADAQLLVLEMGTNEPGEIRTLAEIAGPQVGVITTVSETHLEKLGSLEGVLEEKLDLLRALPPDGAAVVGDEPPLLAHRAREVMADGELSVVGLEGLGEPELAPSELELTEKGCYRFRWMGETVSLRLPGRHAVRNAVVALAVAHILGVAPRDAARRIRRVVPSGMRSEIRTLGSLTLVVDCYNANPQSVAAALELLASVQQLGPRVAVLGSMLELGERSPILHREALEGALARPLDLVVATGLFAEAAPFVSRRADSPELMIAPSLDEARERLIPRLGGTEVVLLKASRGVAMERMIPALEKRFGPSATGIAPGNGNGHGGGNGAAGGAASASKGKEG